MGSRPPRLAFLGLLAALLCGRAAEAQEACPPGATTETGFLWGQPLRLLALHPSDPDAEALAADVGGVGVVRKALQRVEGCWFRGGFTTADGRELEVSRAAFEVLPPSAVREKCPKGARRVPVPAGTRVRVLALHPDDAHYDHRSDLIGRTGYAVRETRMTVGCWQAGPVIFPDGRFAFFFKAAVARDSEPDEAPMYIGPTVTAGRQLEILGVDAAGIHGPERDQLIGLRCEAVEPMPLVPFGMHAGLVHCEDGGTYRFQRVAIALPDEKRPYEGWLPPPWRPPPVPRECPSGAAEAPLPPGEHARILGFGPEDPRDAEPEPFVGLTGVVERTRRNGECWSRGWFDPDEGEPIHFDQVALAPDDPPCPEGSTHFLDAGEGTWLELVGLHPDDAHADLADIPVGTRLIATRHFWPTGACWYAGEGVLADGSEPFFLKGAFRTLGSAEHLGLDCPEGAISQPPAPDDHVRVVRVHPSDPYYSHRVQLVGTSGRMVSAVRKTGACWMSGYFAHDGGSATYFYRVALRPVESEGAPRHAKLVTVPAGRPVAILRVHLFDPNFDAAEALAGASCVAESTLEKVEDRWYTGTVRCGEESYTFDRVEVGLPK